MSNTPQTYFITGASRGIGAELVRRFLARGDTVIAGARAPATATQFHQLKSPKLYIVQLDVTDIGSIKAAAAEVDKIAPEGIDVLINNAGILLAHNLDLDNEDPDNFTRTFEANVVSVLNVTRAFLPALEKRQRRLVVTVTSGAGSNALMGEIKVTFLAASYSVSKAAVNMLNTLFTYYYEHKKITFLPVHPGVVKTDMGKDWGRITVEESVGGMIEVIDKSTFETSGKFFEYTGKPLPCSMSPTLTVLRKLLQKWSKLPQLMFLSTTRMFTAAKLDIDESAADFVKTFDCNVTSVLQVTRAFSDKAAVYMLNAIFTHYYEDKKIIILPIHPGAVKTDMTQELWHTGSEAARFIAVGTSVIGMLNVIDHAKFEDSGSFVDCNGAKLPWYMRNNTRKVIACDLDETLAAALPALVAFHNDRYGTNYTISDYDTLDCHEVWEDSAEEAQQKIREFYKSEYFNRIEPICDGALETLKALKKRKFHMVIITERQQFIAEVTKKFVDKHFPGIFESIYFCNRNLTIAERITYNSKSKATILCEINADVLIDDSLAQVQECAPLQHQLPNGLQILLFDKDGQYRWNKTKTSDATDLPSNVSRVTSWWQILALFPRPPSPLRNVYIPGEDDEEDEDVDNESDIDLDLDDTEDMDMSDMEEDSALENIRVRSFSYEFSVSASDMLDEVMDEDEDNDNESNLYGKSTLSPDRGEIPGDEQYSDAETEEDEEDDIIVSSSRLSSLLMAHYNPSDDNALTTPTNASAAGGRRRPSTGDGQYSMKTGGLGTSHNSQQSKGRGEEDALLPAMSLFSKITSTITSTLSAKLSPSRPSVPTPPSSLQITSEDCDACASPCQQHRQYPRNFNINTEDELLGTMKPYGRHVIIATGSVDWAERIEEASGTLAAALSEVVDNASNNQEKQPKDGKNTKFEEVLATRLLAEEGSASSGTATPTESGAETPLSDGPTSPAPEVAIDTGSNAPSAPKSPKGARIVITNSSFENRYTTVQDASDVYLYPDNIVIPNVHPSNAKEFYDAYLASVKKPSTTFTTQPIPFRSVILICSHKRRDKRCGVAAPLLRDGFERSLRHRDVPEGDDGVAVEMVSHLGGHKYAGNTIIYSHEGKRGAYGAVYLALDLPTRQQYAVKCLPKRHPHDIRHRTFQLRELRLHSLVSSHPNILTLHQILETSDCFWCVLEYAPDGDLFYHITELGAYVGCDEAIRRAFLQIVEAVGYCHVHGVYHRDLKPENILVTNGGRSLKLADFGLATSERKSRDYGCGSTFYFSPECQGPAYPTSKTSVRSSSSHAYSTQANDIWSLGIILINLTTGRNPWKQAHPSDETFAAFCKDPRFLRQILPISRELCDILSCIFCLDPQKRIDWQELHSLIQDCRYFYANPAEDEEYYHHPQVAFSHTSRHHYRKQSDSSSDCSDRDPFYLDTRSLSSSSSYWPDDEVDYLESAALDKLKVTGDSDMSQQEMDEPEPETKAQDRNAEAALILALANASVPHTPDAEPSMCAPLAIPNTVAGVSPRTPTTSHGRGNSYSPGPTSPSEPTSPLPTRTRQYSETSTVSSYSQRKSIGASLVPRKAMFGPYLLLQTVGEGEFGKVKLGVHVETGAEVAIKLIKKENVDSTARLNKVEREISVLRVARHPNIVKMYDVLETDTYIGIIMEYAS
ncbi:hypothetical protein BZG36_05229, partial [Bifiguratus adelaidae]